MGVHINPNFAELRRLVHDLSDIIDVDLRGLELSTLASHMLGASFTNPLLETAIVSDHGEIADLTQSLKALTHLDVKVLSDLHDLEEWVTQAAPLR